MFDRLVAQQVDDGVGRVFVFVIVINDPGNVRAAQIDDQQQSQSDAGPFGFASGERAAQHQRQQRDGKHEKENEKSHLAEAEPRDGGRQLRILPLGKSRLLQVTDQIVFGRGIDQPAEQTGADSGQAAQGPFPVKRRRGFPPAPELGQRGPWPGRRGQQAAAAQPLKAIGEQDHQRNMEWMQEFERVAHGGKVGQGIDELVKRRVFAEGQQ